MEFYNTFIGADKKVKGTDYLLHTFSVVFTSACNFNLTEPYIVYTLLYVCKSLHISR